MTSRYGVSLVLALLVLSGPAAQAFCPTNGVRCGLGGAGVTHKDMTQRALSELGKEFFSVSSQTRAMRDASEEVCDANAAVDDDQTNGFKHFDGESFAAGKQRLVTLYQGILGSLRAEDPQAARLQLGQALHTLQDFYAHSNWTESGHTGALPGLWRAEQPLPSLAGPDLPTCQACEPNLQPDGSILFDCGDNVLTPLLLSGFYGGENEVPRNGAKCRHGGPTDTGPGPFGGINKDTLTQALSPHFPWHSTAADSALEATRQFIRDLKAQLTQRQLALLFGVGPSLVMAVDTSGSMGSLLTQAASRALQLLEARRGTLQAPLRFIVVPFNGASTSPLTAVRQALEASEPDVDLFLLTQSGASDGALAPTVSRLAREKNTRLHPLLFSGGGAPGEPVYRQLASDTGGQLFRLQASDAGAVASLIDATVRAHKVDLLAVELPSSGGQAFSLPIDSSVSRVTFSLSGAPTLTLVRPDGTTVGTGAPGVQVVRLSTGLRVTVLGPSPGVWRAIVNAPAGSSLHVLGESALDLDRFAFVELFGRPGHQGYVALPSLLGLTQAVATAELSGTSASPRFELRSRTGALLLTLVLAVDPRGSPREFFGPAVPPAVPFVVHAVGTTSTGEAFQRVLPRSVW